MLAALVTAFMLGQSVATPVPADLMLRDLDGRPIRLSDLGGRVVFIDVWATWCAPCLAELPTLRHLQQAYPEDPVVVGVSLDSMSRRDFVSWLRRHDVTWTQHFDGRGFGSPAARRLGIDRLPASFLLDRRGRVVGTGLRGTALVEAVERLTRARWLP